MSLIELCNRINETLLCKILQGLINYKSFCFICDCIKNELAAKIYTVVNLNLITDTDGKETSTN